MFFDETVFYYDETIEWSGVMLEFLSSVSGSAGDNEKRVPHTL